MATYTCSNSNSTPLKIRMTYTSNNSTITLTKVEACRTDGYRTYDQDGYIKLNGTKLANATYPDFPANSAWKQLWTGSLSCPKTGSFTVNSTNSTLSSATLKYTISDTVPKKFYIKYHSSDSATASSITTTVTYGTSTKTKTLSELSFSKTGYTFTGWKAYRESDKAYRVYASGSSGTDTWTTSTSGKTFALYNDGASVAQTSSVDLDTIHFYAQWTVNKFTVKYYLTDSSSASSITTSVTYGTSTKTKTLSELSFSRDGYVFKGWKAYRESDKKYRIEGDTWETSLPSGKTYLLYNEGASIAQTSSVNNDVIRFYGQWEIAKVTVKFYRNESSSDLAYVSETYTGLATGNKFGKDTSINNTFVAWGNRVGYNLVGWSKTQGTTSATYGINNTIIDSWISSNQPSINLYAVWIKTDVTLTVDRGFIDSTISVLTIAAPIRSTFPSISVSDNSRINYVFAGWLTDTGATIDSSYVITGNLSVKAQWTPRVYVKVNGEWKSGQAYIKVNGVWKLGEAYRKDSSSWKI